VPRHPERFDEVYRLLQESQLRVVRRSSLSEPLCADNWQVLLVDSVGELKWWWGLAELAIVGGSFGTRGGQNMLEPAAYGAKVAFGPNVSNFRVIVQTLLEKEAVWQLPTLDALPTWIDYQLSRPDEGRGHAERAMALIRSHQGATARTCNLLNTLLKSRAS
jgi:3-deoxy-D-manno-octulosonic-acid transferase